MSDYIVEVFIRTGVLRFRCHLDFYLLFSLDVVHQFAEHEVSEGWYFGLGLNDCSDFNGAPNLYDYIDFDSLGEDLLNSVDESTVVEVDNHVIATDYGF